MTSELGTACVDISLRKLAGLFVMCVILASLCASGCYSSGTIADDVLRRTVPEGDSTPVLSGPVWTGQLAQFAWDFDTHMSAPGYVEWLEQHLHDFQMVDRDRARLRLVKQGEGDAYRLQIVLDQIDGRTLVHARLFASPD
jgi:hypothetical protein